MERTGDDVQAYIATVTPAKRQRDAQTMLTMLRDITGCEPELWSANIIGFGDYQWRYESGREGSAGAAGFAPRKGATVIYLADGVGRYEAELTELGPHRLGVGCLYLTDLERNDLEVLRRILTRSFERLQGTVYTERAREGRPSAETSDKG